jgi:hypothetical protein
MEIVTPGVSPQTEVIERRGSRSRPIRAWGFVDTSKVNSDVFLHALAIELGADVGGDTGVRKAAPGVGLTDDELARLSGECDAVILGFGDCGTSMSFAVRDAVALEHAGVTAVVVCSSAFSRGATQLSKLLGVPSLAVVELPHPLASRTDAEIRQLARDAMPRVVNAARHSSSVDDATEPPIPARLSVSEDSREAIEELHRQGWTDGLPVVPPSIDAVEHMLAISGLKGQQRMPAVPPAQTRSTLERWAANAVMAGCLPEHLAVVLAAMDALLDPDAALASSQVATNSSTPLLLLNGPIRDAVDAARSYNVLGPGSRSTARIGRAVRLILQNIGGEITGLTDLATHGQPGKFTYCFAENEEESPWEPWHVTKGFRPDDSAVTVVMASAPQNIFAYGCNIASDLIDHLVGAMTALGSNNVMFDTGPMIVLGPEHANLLARSGIQREQLQKTLFERARIDLDRFPVAARLRLQTRRARWFETTGNDREIGLADRPQDVHIVVAGGPGIHSQFISTSFSRVPVTRRIGVEFWASTDGGQADRAAADTQLTTGYKHHRIAERPQPRRETNLRRDV